MNEELVCPLPSSAATRVTLAHGGGGRQTQRLVREIFHAAFGNPWLAAAHDGAILDLPGTRLALTTDAHVVHPLFFPGGDIGTLAVHGTVNDLAMCGARPRYLTAGFVLEEGLDLDVLQRVARSMAAAARDADVAIVAGDTKVVERGKGDGLYVTTAGVGEIAAPLSIGPAAVRPGDAVLLSGDLGRHGIAILVARAELALESPVTSDCAPLHRAVHALLASGVEVHCLRDLTRGGLAAALVEVAESAGLDLVIDETAIPVLPAVQAACELLGFEAIHLANEGRFAVWLPAAHVHRALAALRTEAVAGDAVAIGEVTRTGRGTVRVRGAYGTDHVLDLPSGAQLPRIC